MSPAIRGWLETLSICWSAFILRKQPLTRFAATSQRFGTTTRLCASSRSSGGPDKLSPQSRHLLEFLADLTDAGQIATTANWLRKDTYRRRGGPHLAEPGQTWKFRHYQLRRLLERHIDRRGWSAELDLVIDRWRMTPDLRKNLEEYLRGNYKLRPSIATITLVDSAYADPIHVVDIYGRLARRIAEGRADTEEVVLGERLMDLPEVTVGLY